MSILIKDMTMPKNCMACPLVSGYELADEKKVLYSTVRCRLTKAKRPNGESVPKDCPLIEVPKHGRLIDADAISEDDRQVYGFYNNYDLQQLLDACPTIIEAEGEG